MAKHGWVERQRNNLPVTLNLSASNDESKGQPEAGADATSAGKVVWRRLRQHWWAFGLIALLSLGAFGAGMKYLDESAAREKAANGNRLTTGETQSLLSTVNPFVEPTTPTPTPQLSKEYIYAGSRMLAVEDANANAAPPSDLAVWRPSTGFWYVLGGIGSAQTAFNWGGLGDETAPGDYDGDGKTDFSVFRRANSTWYVSNSSNGTTTERVFGGTADDKLAQADYDGDGRTDVAVYRANTGYWYITKSSDQSSYSAQFGMSGDVPTAADFDGDGKADLAVWRSSTATFYYAKSSVPGAVQSIQFGAGNDVPVVGDYDGDGKADATVWKGAPLFQWHTLYSSTNTTYAASLGDPSSDIAVQNDYDGDGKTDMAIWRPSNGTWYIQQSSSGTRNVQWGQAGDIPVPAFYRR